MRIESLHLRNFIGILDGCGCEEITLDMAQLPPGLIALTGDNGTGKSTVLNNLHPFLTVPDDRGNLYDVTRGDAVRTLTFTTGDRRYRSEVRIDADRRKTAPILLREETGNWTAITDGSTEEYKKAITALLGPEELFFASAFVSQTAPRLGTYRPAELRELFSLLFPLEQYAAYTQTARKVKDALLANVSALKTAMTEAQEKAASLDRIKEDLTALEQERARTEAARAQAEARKNKLTGTIQALREELARLSESAELRRVTLESITGLEEEQERLIQETEEAKRNLAKEQEARDAARALHTLTKTRDVIAARITKGEEYIKELENKRQTAEEVKQEIVRLETAMDGEKQLAESKLAELQERLVLLGTQTEAISKVPCREVKAFVQTCPLLKEAQSARDTLPTVQAEIATTQIKAQRAAGTDELAVRRCKLETMGRPDEQQRRAQTKLSELRAELQKAERALRNATESAALLAAIEQAKKRRDEYGKRLGSIPARIEELQRTLRETPDTKSLQQDLARHENTLRTVEAEIASAGKTLLDFAAKEGDLRRALQEGQHARVRLQTCEATTNRLADEAGLWALLEEATGRTGIQVLEMEAAIPELTSLSNDLLLSCFGPRFAVKIDTLRQSRREEKLLDDFRVAVFDAEAGRPKPLKHLSGGERIWIQSALTLAMTLLASRSLPHAIESFFEDEADGALSPENRLRYLALKRRSLALGNFHHGFVISQDPAVAKACDAVIAFAGGNHPGIQM